jgi:hypothetical protein
MADHIGNNHQTYTKPLILWKHASTVAGVADHRTCVQSRHLSSALYYFHRLSFRVKDPDTAVFSTDDVKNKTFLGEYMN